MDKTDNKTINFPVDWTFRIIVLAQSAPSASIAVKTVMESFGVPGFPQKGASSSGGKYETLTFSMVLPDHATMDKIANDLSKISGVKVVI